MRVENLQKRYGGQEVLSGLSFTAEKGVTAIMAPSGRGKTTLLRILLGLETAEAGTIHDGPKRWSAVFQEDRLLSALDAMGNLRFAIGPGLEEGEAHSLLDRLGLGAEGDKAVENYSGGMKRRLCLARALLAHSDAIVLDEPFTGLDGENRRACLDAIQDAAKEKMVLLVTHDDADAEALGARVVRL